jgi:hypothetical protein
VLYVFADPDGDANDLVTDDLADRHFELGLSYLK